MPQHLCGAKAYPLLLYAGSGGVASPLHSELSLGPLLLAF